MRAIKFRGRSVVNSKHQGIKVGNWIYGSYIESGCDAPCIVFGDGEQCEIDRKTLGQLTGEKYKTGADIYEGDLFVGDQYPFFADDPAHNYVGEVVFEGLRWAYDLYCVNPKLRGCAGGGSLESICDGKVTAIGNIHESPELLEG